MHTEEEAKTKWCPHVRHQSWIKDDGNLVVCVNREPRLFAEANDPHVSMCNCLASDCTAWRWSKANVVSKSALVSPSEWGSSQPSPQLPFGYAETKDGCAARIVPLGYCGLAGKP